jgi:hypothetical protein
MKSSRFSEEQIIGILIRPYLLPLEVQIRGNGGLRSQEAQGSGRGEPTAQAAAVGERIGPSGVEDALSKKY